MKQNIFRFFRALMLAPLMTAALMASTAFDAGATPIPTLSFFCTQPLTATTSCVNNGYFATGWTTGGYWQYTVNTVPYHNITMTFNTRKSSATGPTAANVYYNIGGVDVLVTSFAMTTACTPHTISFPVACSNQPNLRVKIVMTGATAASAACYMPADGGFDGI